MASAGSEVKIGNGTDEKVILMRHPPKVGSLIVVAGDGEWRVLSVTREIPYRVPAMTIYANRESA